MDLPRPLRIYLKRTRYLNKRRKTKRSEELITAITRVIILVISALVTRWVIPFIKTKIGEYRYAELRKFIEDGVKAMKQYYGDSAEYNQMKKARVTGMAKEFMRNTLKLELTDAQLDLLIEGIYNGVKQG